MPALITGAEATLSQLYPTAAVRNKLRISRIINFSRTTDASTITGTEATLSQLHPTASFLVVHLTTLTEHEIYSMNNEYYFKTD
jgi:hypothetical protein